jgi:hypothetical protein
VYESAEKAGGQGLNSIESIDSEKITFHFLGRKVVFSARKADFSDENVLFQ